MLTLLNTIFHCPMALECAPMRSQCCEASAPLSIPIQCQSRLTRSQIEHANDSVAGIFLIGIPKLLDSETRFCWLTMFEIKFREEKCLQSEVSWEGGGFEGSLTMNNGGMFRCSPNAQTGSISAARKLSLSLCWMSMKKMWALNW